MKKGVVGIVSLLAGVVGGAIGTERFIEPKLNKAQQLSDKHLALFLMMNQWVKVKQEGKNLAAYFENKGYKKIAVYGMSYVGETLVNELKGTGIQIAYGIDQKSESIYADMDIVSMDELLEQVDAVVVTPITFFDEIEEKLSNKINCSIISLEDILYEV